MDHSPLPLLMVRCEASQGVLLLNGTMWGELCDHSPVLSIPLSIEGRFCLTFLPYEPGFLPTTSVLSLSGGQLKTPHRSALEYLSWPGGIIELSLHPHRALLPKELVMPQSVAQRYLGDQTATLYYDGDMHLAIERMGDDTLLLHHTLSAIPQSPVIEFRHVGENPAVLLSDPASGYMLCAREQRGEYTLLFEAHGSFQITGNSIEATTDLGDVVGHQIRSSYFSGSSTTETGFFTRSPAWPQTGQDTAKALIQALSLHNTKEAALYLSPQLAEEFTIEEIQSFFQGFLTCRQPLFTTAPGEICVGVINEQADQGRLFCFDMLPISNEYGPYKIDNIREL
ncbi:MAG: hypothetical protein ACOYI4_00775 [Christensenellales bacterium]